MHQGHFDALMSLSAGSLEDLNWWVFHLPSASKNIYHSPPNLILHTDASGIGWGATLSNGSTTHGIWSQAEASRHINYLELQAVYLALSSLLNNETNVHVRVMCDNVTAVTYINEMGGCKSEQCNSVAKLIWNWAIARRIWVSAAHVAGSANINADHLSRNVNLNLEWMLSTATFQAIVNMFGQPDIDLFASGLNAQLETYVSWKPDPKAKYIDAFSIVWSGFFYAFPPFCLASRCVQKIIQDKATGILVIPLWPTQPFFSVVLRPADGSATYAQGDSSQLGSSYLGGSSSTSGSTEATGMQIIRRSLEDADIPPDVTDVIMHSWRHSTHKQYDHYIAKWVQFCSQGTCDPLCPTVKGLLMFLHSLYRKGMSYSSLNTARSAVSNLDFDIGQNPNSCIYR